MVRFKAIYGGRWHVEVDVDDTWLIGLQGLTHRELWNGIRLCVEIGRDRERRGEEDWPPSLGVFRSLCEKPDPRTHGLFKQIAPVPSDPKVVAAALAKMRRIVGLPPLEDK